MRFSLAIVLEMVVAVAALGATSAPPAPNGVESLGNQLLDDLGPNGEPPTVHPQSAQELKATSDVDPSMKASTPLHSFGVARVPPKNRLRMFSSGMHQAEALLAQPGAFATSAPVQLAGTVQQEVLSDLDKLIAELSKQCQCNGGQCNGNKPCDKPGTKPGRSGAAAGSGRTAARDSTDRLDRTSAQPVDKGKIDETVKSLWGNLPVRSREQMLQSFSDEFLPKYEIEIEQYYRRLSEEQGKPQPK